MTETETRGEATYDPDDNKLRFRPDYRLDDDELATVKRYGFRWAPRQKLFVCPAWSPQAEDLMLAWCGEIGDEDTTLADRAADRAERFETYSDKRAAESEREHDRVSELADAIPLGQPILVGHHSEKRARKDAERIDRGMRKAVQLWRTSEYWNRRAAGVVASAEYKDKPAVRARRIKTLEAERRKQERRFTPQGEPFTDRPWCLDKGKEDGHPWDETCPKCEPQPMVFVGPKGRGAHPVAVAELPAIEANARRWIEHLDRRLAYERAILESQGAADLLKPKARPKAPPILNYPSPGGIETRNRWTGEPETLPQERMTKAEYKALLKDDKGTRPSADGSHRVRIAILGRGFTNRRWVSVFLTDSKEHPAPQVTP